jgi:hypothetical protein
VTSLVPLFGMTSLAQIPGVREEVIDAGRMKPDA